MSAVPQTEGLDAAIRPFTVHFPDSDLADLKRCIEGTRFSEREPVADHSQGTQLATLQMLTRYWATEYDWRKVETKLNSYPNFLTEIDGLDIHFIHIRSRHKNALPVLIAHGWPGSIVEQMKLIEPLTNPTAHGGTAEDAFDVVIPSMPGYGFSEKPTQTGWDGPRIARTYAVLMQRLGYEEYVAQGGDWGALVVDQMGVQEPKGLLGIHTNMPAAVPVELHTAAFLGEPTPAGLSAEERNAYEELRSFFRHVHYAFYMGDRPQTLSGLADSPAFLAGFMLDHDAKSLAMISRVFDGVPEGMTRDDVLDNVTLFWLTNTGVSAARLYRENKLPFFSPEGVKLPVVVSAFPDELYPCPRSWAEKAYPNLVYFNKRPKGGHFAAWEQPKSLYGDMRAGFRTLRK